jgi:hypothetical protein
MPASLGILITIGIALLVVLGLLVAFIMIVAPARPTSIEESPGFPIELKTGNDKSS